MISNWKSRSLWSSRRPFRNGVSAVSSLTLSLNSTETSVLGSHSISRSRSRSKQDDEAYALVFTVSTSHLKPYFFTFLTTSFTLLCFLLSNFCLVTHLITTPTGTSNTAIQPSFFTSHFPLLQMLFIIIHSFYFLFFPLLCFLSTMLPTYFLPFCLFVCLS